ncbi:MULTISPECIES: acetylxylan esterase [unclassified Rathayibacter]|uniref:acetylxylan esterase n=1 Tax=unclassified Rathayibacter TaxID=2609250 RepID=UPI000F4C3B01|nr:MULTISPECIES: acetylxylan esterase [unclassified Rathayibacter]ROP49151.1 cephalosporin-C deacetylase [Rathayibacter sp. PhB186]ROS50732.1 cephalosporin-C deacetylase [Rathayibacter sp. PhB185]
MAFFDLTLPELQVYMPDREEPDEFDAFWSSTIAESRALAAEPRFEDVDAGYSELITQDVRFSGFGGQEISGWFIAPRHRTGPLPVVVSYLGYGGGRGLIGSWSQLPSAGIAQFVMDSRGQGSGYRPGSTPDGEFTGPSAGGVMTLGIEDPSQYYYRRLFTDAVLAVDAARRHPLADPDRIVVSGGSQGGGIALAAAGLSEGLAGAVIDVPFLCGFRRATGLVDTFPYGEIVRYLHVHRGDEERVFRTLSYFDGINFAARSSADALFSVGLMDQVCPPSTVFAAFNHYGGAKRIEVYPYNGHENGEEFQGQKTVEFVRDRVSL